jgi:hypothetical protein
MKPVRVPQNLHLDDVLMFGLGATDLLCLAVGGFVAYWLVVTVPAPMWVRGALAAPALGAALLLGAGRLGEQTARDLLIAVALYLRRDRLRLYDPSS